MGPSRDLPPAFGATLTRDGVDFAVYAGRADGVDICLFEPGDTTGDSERRVALGNRAHGTWFGSVPGLGAGARDVCRDGPPRHHRAPAVTGSDVGGAVASPCLQPRARAGGPRTGQPLGLQPSGVLRASRGLCRVCLL